MRKSEQEKVKVPVFVRKGAVALLLVTSFYLLHSGQWLTWFSPDFSYRFVTGNETPAGVQVVRFGTIYNDNLFHLAYCWQFEHDEAGLELLKQQLRANGSQSGDAIWSLADFVEALGLEIGQDQIGQGYEINNDNNRRDHWWLVDKNARTSYLEWN